MTNHEAGAWHREVIEGQTEATIRNLPISRFGTSLTLLPLRGRPAFYRVKPSLSEYEIEGIARLLV